MIRELVIFLRISKYCNYVWSYIYPHTPLFRKRNKALQNILSNFICQGDLVFDIGANVGNYTNLFLAMGCRKVIAVEPNQNLAKRLVKPKVECLIMALAEKNKISKYYVSEINGLSTLSPVYTNLKRFKNIKWKNEITIFTTTLDELQKEYGTPNFIKIDAEGYEANIILGMHFAPKALSFEFIPENIGSIKICAERLNELGNYDYNYTIELTPNMKFILPYWGNYFKVMEHIKHNVKKNSFGDIYAKRKR